MAPTSIITIEPGSDGRWLVQADGSAQSRRSFDRLGEAEAYARSTARQVGGGMLVKGSGGHVQRLDTPTP